MSTTGRDVDTQASTWDVRRTAAPAMRTWLAGMLEPYVVRRGSVETAPRWVVAIIPALYFRTEYTTAALHETLKQLANGPVEERAAACAAVALGGLPAALCEKCT